MGGSHLVIFVCLILICLCGGAQGLDVKTSPDDEYDILVLLNNRKPQCLILDTIVKDLFTTLVNDIQMIKLPNVKYAFVMHNDEHEILQDFEDFNKNTIKVFYDHKCYEGPVKPNDLGSVGFLSMWKEEVNIYRPSGTGKMRLNWRPNSKKLILYFSITYSNASDFSHIYERMRVPPNVRLAYFEDEDLTIQHSLTASKVGHLEYKNGIIKEILQYHVAKSFIRNGVDLVVVHSKMGAKCHTAYDINFDNWLDNRIRKTHELGDHNNRRIRELERGQICMSLTEWQFGPDSGLIVDDQSDKILLYKSLNILRDNGFALSVLYQMLINNRYMAVVELEKLSESRDLQSPIPFDARLSYWVLNAFTNINYSNYEPIIEDVDKCPQQIIKNSPPPKMSHPWDNPHLTIREFYKKQPPLFDPNDKTKPLTRFIIPSFKDPLEEIPGTYEALYTVVREIIENYAIMYPKERPKYFYLPARLYAHAHTVMSYYFHKNMQHIAKKDIIKEYYFEPAFVIPLEHIKVTLDGHPKFKKILKLIEETTCKALKVMMTVYYYTFDEEVKRPVYKTKLDISPGCHPVTNAPMLSCIEAPVYKYPFGAMSTLKYVRTLNLGMLSDHMIEPVVSYLLTNHRTWTFSHIPNNFVLVKCLFEKCKNYLLSHMNKNIEFVRINDPNCKDTVEWVKFELELDLERHLHELVSFKTKPGPNPPFSKPR